MSNLILQPTQKNIQLCAEILKKGKPVCVPTETVYGLACNALDTKAAREVFKIKGRPLIDPLIVHFRSIDQCLAHIETNQSIERLAELYWPGPLTIIAHKRSSIPDIITAGLKSVAVRIPAHPAFRKLLKELDFPLAAPSANPFGYVSPTKADHVKTTLGNKIQAILDGGQSTHGLESTIIDLRAPKAPKILRHGPISIEALTTALEVNITNQTYVNADTTSSQIAPGMLTSHYSPNADITLFETQIESLSQHEKDTAVIFNKKPTDTTLRKNCFWLSEDGSLKSIAHNLFNLIQNLDQQGFKKLYIQKPDTKGIGKAILDRLLRAAAKKP